MEPKLIDYRCTCGKLLFKGLLLASVVEIKCKRCGRTQSFRDTMQGSRSFMLVVDGEGRIMDACEGIRVLECSRQYAIGKPLLDILPLARDGQYQKIMSDGTYQIKNNTLLLRDCRMPLESHVVPVKNGSLYRAFNVIKEA